MSRLFASLRLLVASVALLWLGLTAAQAQMGISGVDPSQVTTVELQARPTLALAAMGDWDDPLVSLSASIKRLQDEAQKKGLKTVGLPFVAFVDTDDRGFRFEAMLALAERPDASVSLAEGMRFATSPAGKTLRFQHRGTYEDIETTYEMITAYLDEKGLEAQNLFVEEYISLPATAEEEGAQVDIFVFLK